MANLNLIDIDIYDRTDNRGAPLSFEDGEAVGNAITAYLTARKGDYYRKPTFGGLLDDLLFRVQRTEYSTKEADILADLQEKFAFFVTINSVTITPDPIERLIQVDVTYTISRTQEAASLTVFKRFVPKYVKDITYIDVPFAGENLVNFITSEIEIQPKSPLIFNPQFQLFTWNHYRFTNFSANSDEFQYILELLNSPLPPT
jgi:hypothetical protein